MSHRPPHDPSRGIVPLTPGPDPLAGQASDGNRLDLPVVIVSALEATGTRLQDFLVRLAQGAIWQDQSIRSADGEIDIQAYLAPEGIRCVIRIGQSTFYHHPLGTFHIFGMPQPEMAIGDGIPFVFILPHELLDTIPIMATGMTPLNANRPDLGICIRVTMPRLEVHVPARSR